MSAMERGQGESRRLWSRGRTVALTTGVAATAAGVFVLWWAGPSPHGYLELFFGLPLLGVGLLTTGVALAFGSGPVWRRTLGWTIVVAPVILIVVLALAT
jgi:hypothetical protein